MSNKIKFLKFKNRSKSDTSAFQEKIFFPPIQTRQQNSINLIQKCKFTQILPTSSNSINVYQHNKLSQLQLLFKQNEGITKEFKTLEQQMKIKERRKNSKSLEHEKLLGKRFDWQGMAKLKTEITETEERFNRLVQKRVKSHQYSTKMINREFPLQKFIQGDIF